MKIILHLSLKQLGSLVYVFDKLTKEPYAGTSREIKVSRSILDKVILAFRTKHFVESQKSPLQTRKKKYKFSLEIFEADKLEIFVSLMTGFPLSEYDRNVINFIKDNLNQQLA